MQIGTADPEHHAAGAPTLADFTRSPVLLEDVEVFQVLWEIKSGGACELLPPALHPTIPAVLGWLVYRCPQSPWGAFTLAQSRLECRSGTRPRAFLISGVIDNEAAGEALASGWGYRLDIGELDFRRNYDGVTLRVGRDGRSILEVGMRGSDLLPPDVIQFVSGLHPAHTPNGYRLVQADAVHKLTRAERGEAYLDLFDSAAWGEARIEPHYPISAAVGIGSVTLSKLRYVCKPGELAFTGTETL